MHFTHDRIRLWRRQKGPALKFRSEQAQPASHGDAKKDTPFLLGCKDGAGDKVRPES